MKVNEILDEDWKSALANTAMAGALVGTGAAMLSPGKDRHPIDIEGKTYIKHELPSDKSKLEIKTDSKGNKVYTWVEKAGMRPQYTYYWYAPIKASK